jgi:ribosomal-protein-alanine N-acetyltransferase
MNVTGSARLVDHQDAACPRPHDPTGREADVIKIRPVEATDETAFTTLAKQSLKFHESFILAPKTPEAFERYIKGFEGDASEGYVICRSRTEDIVGFVNVNGIIRFPYDRGILGYGIFEPYARRGYMKQALGQVIDIYFNERGLHRLEADIQPENHASTNLVKSLGFICEGVSRGFIKINDVWTDHARWALVRNGDPRES